MDNAMIKVAVIFIGTGKYLKFLPSWYESCEEYLLPTTEKKYLIFTDGEVLDSPENSIVYSQEHLNWPLITLYRFKILQQSFKDIQDYDWLIFLDADMQVVKEINENEFLDRNKKYLGVHHPCHFLKMSPHNQFPGAFDTTSFSTASITESDDLSVYFQGCLWGGKIPEVLEMIDELAQRIDIDYERNIIAKWHDESHLNKFYAENLNDVKVLSSEYAYPELFSSYCDFEPRIVHLAKDNSQYQI